MKVHGVSLHMFDETNNSDKFYRAFVWQDKGSWNVSYHWGRDGAPRGQIATSCHFSLDDADRTLKKKINEKLRKGYEYLGQGEIDVADISSEYDLACAGHKLHNRVGRTPTKLPNGFSLVIREEDDIEDLIHS